MNLSTPSTTPLYHLSHFFAAALQSTVLRSLCCYYHHRTGTISCTIFFRGNIASEGNAVLFSHRRFVYQDRSSSPEVRLHFSAPHLDRYIAFHFFARLVQTSLHTTSVNWRRPTLPKQELDILFRVAPTKGLTARGIKQADALTMQKVVEGMNILRDTCCCWGKKAYFSEFPSKRQTKKTSNNLQPRRLSW